MIFACLGGKKIANLHFLGTYSVTLVSGSATVMAKWAFSLGGFYILGVHCLYE